MKRMFIKLTALFLMFALSIPFINGCKKIENNSKSDKLTVAVTILPEQDFVEAVCGDLVNVITIVPLGSSPESYEPTIQQIEEFASADVYFTIGVPCEKAKALSEPQNASVVKLEEKAEAVYADLKFSDDSRDPHIWLSPKRVIVMVNTIAEELSKLDAKNAETYNKNAASYIKNIQDMITYTQGLYKNITEENRVFLTFHPAYGYFADEFGLKMYSLEEEGKEATAQDLQNLIKFAKENNIKVLFSQAESDSAQPETFVAEVGGRVEILNPLSKDYINNMKYMAEKIAGALE